MGDRRRLASLHRHLTPRWCQSVCSSPLDKYRELASFDPLHMSWFVDGQDVYEFKQRVWSTLSDDPLFRRPVAELTMDETRRLAFRQLKRVVEYEFLTSAEMVADPLKARALNICLGAYDWSVAIMYGLHATVSHVTFN